MNPHSELQPRTSAMVSTDTYERERKMVDAIINTINSWQIGQVCNYSVPSDQEYDPLESLFFFFIFYLELISEILGLANVLLKSLCPGKPGEHASACILQMGLLLVTTWSGDSLSNSMWKTFPYVCTDVIQNIPRKSHI